MWVFSIFIDYPITHQDIDSGTFYTGFGGFIDYYKLDGLVLLALIGIAIGLLIQTIDSLYLKQIFDNKNKKVKFIYIIRNLSLFVAIFIIEHIIFKPWSFSLDFFTGGVIGLYVLLIVGLTICISKNL